MPNEDQDTRITEGNALINQYFRETYKPTEKIILENEVYFDALREIRNITIMGHSLSEVDIKYFQAIVQRIDRSKVKWKISYYGVEELAAHRQTMASLGVKEELVEFDKLQNF